MQSDAGAVALPSSIHHIGVVVEDIDKTMEFLSSIWGLGPWQTFEYVQGKEGLLAGEPFRLKVAFVKVGPTQFELLQPVEGNSVWAQFLKTNGEGVHHVAFMVPNWDEMVSHVLGHGGRMIAGGRAEAKEEAGKIMVVGSATGMRWCYLDTKPGGIIVEFMDELGSERVAIIQ